MDTDEFTFKLYEHIAGVWFSVQDIETEADMHPSEHELPDMQEVTTIAEYLIDTEELGDQDVELLLTLGLFIHGFNHRNDPI